MTGLVIYFTVFTVAARTRRGTLLQEMNGTAVLSPTTRAMHPVPCRRPGNPRAADSRS